MSESSSPQTRVRQACDPCRRKKVRCPGERPVCSFCNRLNQRCSYERTSVGPGFRVEKERRDGPSQGAAQYADGHRVQRLEARVDQIMNAVNTLVQLQSGDSPARLPAPSTPTLNIAPLQPGKDTRPRTEIVASDSFSRPDPPPLEVLQSLVKLYTDRIAGQPLPLFDTEALPNSIHRWSKGLFNSFLALTVRYSDHVFFGDASAAAAAAAERYKKSASEILFAQLADSTADLEVFQGFCLLCLSEIYDGNMRKAWIAVGVATRLAISSGIMGTKIDGVLVNSELSRCCWSLFILDRIHGSSFLTLPAIFNEDSFPEMPPSPARPDVSNQNAAIESGEPQITLEKDLGINSYALQLLSIWGRLMSYLKNIRQGNLEDAWAANSTYQQIKSEMSRVETILPEVHRFRNSRFHELTLSELESHRAYWASWIFTQLVYHCIHCTLNHPFLHIARIPGQRRLRSPSFLQHATDQAVLHSAWVVLILGVCEQSGFKIFDPFIGHLASMIATAQFFLQFSKDETLAARASKDFRMLQGFVEKMSGTHAHLEHVASKLSRLAQFATGSTETNSFLPPKIETALLWNLLDYAVSSSTVVDGGDPSDNVEVAVNTQFLLPINAETPMPVSAQPHQQEGPRPDFWDQTTFEFDMADFANVSDMSGWTVPNESWITGHL